MKCVLVLFQRFVVIFLPVGFVFVFAFHLTVLEPTTGPTSPQGKQTEGTKQEREMPVTRISDSKLVKPLLYKSRVIAV